MGANAVGGMEVEGSLEAVLVHVVDERLGLRDAVRVPAPARPAALVPIHIHDEHVHRNVVVLHVADYLLELGPGVSPVAAVPVAEDVFRRHRHTASHLDEVAEACLVVVSVAEEVPVGSRPVDRVGPPGDAVLLGFKGVRGTSVASEGRRTLIDDAPASPRQQTLLEVAAFVVAPSLVERAVRAQQVHGVVLAGVPSDGASVHLERDHQVVGLLVGLLEDAAFLVA